MVVAGESDNLDNLADMVSESGQMKAAHLTIMLIYPVFYPISI